MEYQRNMPNLQKKSDVKECSNYRSISILNTAYKILSIILCECLKPYVGHLARMNDDNVAKHVFERNPEGRRISLDVKTKSSE